MGILICIGVIFGRPTSSVMNQSMFHLSLGSYVPTHLRNGHSESFTVAPLMTISYPILVFRIRRDMSAVRSHTSQSGQSQVSSARRCISRRACHYLWILCNQARLDREANKHYERFRKLDKYSLHKDSLITALWRVECSLSRHRRIAKWDTRSIAF